MSGMKNSKTKEISGGITDENPILLAKLTDDYGINISGTSIGHDLTAVLDDNDQQTYILNSFYESELDDYTKWVQDIVEEQKAIYGELPAFDFGKYTFLCSYNPWVYGDGMEHRNSTICSSKGNLYRHRVQLIGTISHEFFHAWNVERIRPKSLQPFAYDKANMSGELWFAEGFTSYYTGLVLCRAGIRAPESFVRGLSNNINYITNYTGRKYRTPIQMSQHAPYVDAANSNDPNNFNNTYVIIDK